MLKALFKMLVFKAIMLGLIAYVVSLCAQQVAGTLTQPGSSSITGDVWFWIFVGWYVFSAVVTGMPEPTPESSPWYIWAYRSFHILAASGTSFFQNKLYWPTTRAKEEKGQAQ